MTLMTSTRHRIESRLYHLGFSSAIVRHLLCTQVMICGAAVITGAALFWLTLWPLFFAAGALIATYSFWQISRVVQASLRQQYSAALGLKLFFGFSGRLVLISIVLFALIVWLRAPILPLVIGLTSTIAGIVAWGISRRFRKTVKEA